MPECGESNSVSFDVTCTGGIPAITSTDPASVVAGSGDFTLTVNGVNFRSDSVVRWNGTALTTTYVSSIKLTAAVPGAFIAASATINVTVFNPLPGCGESEVFTFEVTVPVSAGSLIGATLESGTSSDVTLRPSGTFVPFPADNKNAILCIGGTLRNFYVEIEGFGTNDGLDVGQSFTATLYINDAPKTITTSGVGPNSITLYSDTTHTETVAQGDRIRVEYTQVGTVSIRGWSLEFVNADGAAIIGIGWGYGFQDSVSALKANEDIPYSIITGTNAGSLQADDYVQLPWPNDGTFKNAYLNTSNAQPGTGTMVATLHKNGAGTALAVTVTAGGSAGAFSNIADSVAVAQGDLVNWRIVNNAATDAAKMIALMAECVLNDGGLVLASLGFLNHAIGFSYSPPFSQDTYYMLGENQFPVPRDGTLKNLFVFISNTVNPTNGDCGFTVMVNGVDTAITTTAPAGVSGTFSDTAHTVAVSKGDLVTVHITTATNINAPGGGYTLELL